MHVTEGFRRGQGGCTGASPGVFSLGTGRGRKGPGTLCPWAHSSTALQCQGQGASDSLSEMYFLLENSLPSLLLMILDSIFLFAAKLVCQGASLVSEALGIRAGPTRLTSVGGCCPEPGREADTDIGFQISVTLLA